MSVPEYLPGAWSAVSRPGFVALLGPTAAPTTARALWEASADGLLAGLVVLARDGFGGLPSFALVHVERGRAHLALRGDVTAEVGTTSGSHTVRAGEVGTWSEQVLDDVTWVRLRNDDAPDEGAGLPLGDGVAPAAALRVVLVEDEAVVEPVAVVATQDAVADELTEVTGPHEPSAPDVIDVPDLALPAPTPPAPEETVLEADAPDTPAAGARAFDEPAFDEPTVDEPQDVAPELDEPAQEPATAEAAPEPVVADEAAVDEPVFGDASASEDVVVPSAAEPASTEPALPAPSLPAPSAPQAVLPEPVVEPVLPEPASEPVPALVALGAPEADVESTVDATRTLVGPASADDHDGLTILSSDLAQIREQLPAWASQWPQEGATPGPFEVPTPAPAVEPARLVLSTGVEVTLDRTVLLGRAPQVARVTNRELPRLVAVPSPQQDISRTHAEVRAEGEHVLVTDLHSTNGVHVSRQGEGARRLHPGEPSVVVPGEVVDLGDGVTFTVVAGGR